MSISFSFGTPFRTRAQTLAILLPVLISGCSVVTVDMQDADTISSTAAEFWKIHTNNTDADVRMRLGGPTSIYMNVDKSGNGTEVWNYIATDVCKAEGGILFGAHVLLTRTSPKNFGIVFNVVNTTQKRVDHKYTSNDAECVD